MRKLTALIIVGLLLVKCGPAEKETQVVPSPFEANYHAYANVLEKYTRGETVDYRALKNDRTDLDNFVGQLAGLTLEQYDSMDGGEQLAFWINAYNALTLRTVIDAYPVKSINDIEGAMDDAAWDVAGKTVTLDNIRDDILLHEFEDARALLALNWASVDGPAIMSTPFTGEAIDDQLDSVAYAFVNEVSRNTINPHKNVVTTSKIFSLYGENFAAEYDTEDFPHLSRNDRAVLNFIFTFADDSITEFIDEEAEWKVEYRPFDWALNDVKR